MIFYRNECGSFDYELEDVIKLFFLPSEINKTETPWEDCSEAFLFCHKEFSDSKEYVCVKLKDSNFVDEIKIHYEVDLEDKQQVKSFKRALKRQLFKLLTRYTKKEIPWGIMTGIRPAKLVNELLDYGINKDGIFSTLTEDYFVTSEKVNLLYDVVVNQRRMFQDSKVNSVSVYIGIPFCPSRCLYCSFSSSTISQYKNMIDLYVDTLLNEIEHTSKLIKLYNFEIESIYIGGGTPTSLNNRQLSKLLEGVEKSFNLSSLKEYTIEAGRPDTIDFDKLKVIKDSKVNRISINPQTMNAITLQNIGRRHSPADIVAAFLMAREIGFDNINMDIICGLPGEDISMFKYTLEKIGLLAPDSLTVHTMAIKRASRLTEEKENYSLDMQYAYVSEMVSLAGKYAEKMGLSPYYLYRQKNILGNLENVGYSKKGKECLYNIQIMEERQSIFACGQGAVTKLIFPNNRLERAFNVKSVEEYIGRIDEMVERKINLCKQYQIIDIDNAQSEI